MKTIIKIFGALVAILIIGFLVISLTIDGIIKSNIEEIGTEMLQTEVRVDDVSVSIFDSQGYIDGVIVENPESFSDSAAVELKEINISLDLYSLLSDTVVIDTLIINQPELYVEQKMQENNMMVLQRNLEESSTDESGGMIIDYLLIEEGIITAHVDVGEERTVRMKLESFEQKGIGREGSNTLESSVRQIMEPILERAIQEALKGGIRDEIEDRIKNLLDG